MLLRLIQLVNWISSFGLASFQYFHSSGSLHEEDIFMGDMHWTKTTERDHLSPQVHSLSSSYIFVYISLGPHSGASNAVFLVVFPTERL